MISKADDQYKTNKDSKGDYGVLLRTASGEKYLGHGRNREEALASVERQRAMAEGRK